MLKIVTYNVNGLRQRVSQFGSLLKLLNSFDAHIICFQEIKLTRQELTSDLAMAEGYESFISCTRTSGKGRTGYSGVATFCRVNLAFSSTEVALPVTAEEGFTGLLEASRNSAHSNDGIFANDECLADFTEDELLKIDSEGRCIITDHGHFGKEIAELFSQMHKFSSFHPPSIESKLVGGILMVGMTVLFNLYGPRADADDMERIHFKTSFYCILQKRWELLQQQGRRIIVVGDLNIAPSAIDRCEAGPEFEQNEFRRWLRSLLVKNGGTFYDLFREKHPERKDAYTCWAVHNGAEEFNYGSRIDHILASGVCLHELSHQPGHGLVSCHVEECDIMLQFRRWKPGSTPRWKGGRNSKLEGSDHVPVYAVFKEIPDCPPHSTPPLSARYIPEIRGSQQSIVSILMKRCVEQTNASQLTSTPAGDYTTESSFSSKRDYHESSSTINPDELPCSLNSSVELTSVTNSQKKRKVKGNKSSQLSLKSFFQKAPGLTRDVSDPEKDPMHNPCDASDVSQNLKDSQEPNDSNDGFDKSECCASTSTMEQSLPSENSKRESALLEWKRIQQFMQDSIPLCNGHKEPCVPRVVKKQGPNFGRRFYVCARSEGPSSNPETSCDFFRWAGAKPKTK